MSPKDFYGKKVLILGLGLHGGGVAAAHWFFRHGAESIITDIKTRVQLEPSVARLTTLCNSYRLAHPSARLSSPEYILGKQRVEDVLRADIVIQNPGVPRDNALLTVAREKGIPIHNDASIFFSCAPDADTIGVTGTRGKTTTVICIGELLKKKYPQTLVAGFALPSGAVSFFSILDKVCEWGRTDTRMPTVLELSSWQLELLAEHHLGPRVAVITNIYPDHLNRYDSMDAYVRAKKSIVQFQSTAPDGAVSILNYDNSWTRTIGNEIESRGRYWFSRANTTIDRGAYIQKKGKYITVRHVGVDETICSLSDVPLRGAHNEENILAACTVGMIYGVSAQAMREACYAMRGVPSRLEHRGQIDGRSIINDTTATSPDASVAALKTYGGRSRRIVLIAGGADKELDFSDMGRAIARYCKALILLSGTASPLLYSSAHTAGYAGTASYANSMREAVERAWQASVKGDTILLSPGAASFGMFVNEFDRGNQFLEAVKKLEGDEV